MCVSSAIARWAIRLAVRLLPVGQYAAVSCYGGYAPYARLARLCAHFVARIRLAVRLLPVGQYAAVSCYGGYAPYARLARLCAHFVARIRLAVLTNPH